MGIEVRPELIVGFAPDRGYFIAGYADDEDLQCYCRVSEDVYPTYLEAARALVNGGWIPA